ncbi:MAG: glycosyltransferase [Planctomycetota bacterium]|jgi:glycosyltransferase involved in cell wall biosynthesis
MNTQPIKNVGFISTRIAGTDGVSLELEKWTEVLKRNQFDCFYFAGEIDRDDAISFIVDEAHFEHPEIYDINKSLFGVIKRSRKISRNIQKIQEKLKSALYEFCKKFKIDLIIPENALTIPVNIPLGIAITEFIAETGIPTIAHHHDFYWERDRFLINACQDYLDKAFPPDLHSMRHVVINSPASRQLSHRLGISNTIIPNVYDFAKEPEGLEDFPCELRSKIGIKEDELFVLQPTRSVSRKSIERSVEIVNSLILPNPTLVISHASGDEEDDYYHRIMEYSKFMGVKIIPIDHLIGNNHGNGDKKYSTADLYKCADIVTYPSVYEGFGSAFLEAIYYYKPIIVNRYPIYVADIEPKGFDVITIGGFVTAKTVAKINQVLKDEEHRGKMVKKNYDLAKQFFSFEILEKKLLYTMSTFD